MEKDVRIIKFDIWSILKIILVILVIFFLYWIREILLIVFLGFLFAIVFTPIVDFLERKKINRYLGSFLVYLILLGIVAGVIIPLAPIVSRQFHYLIDNFSAYYEKIIPYLNLKIGQSFSESNIPKLFKIGYFPLNSTNLFNILGKFAGWIAIIIMTFVVAFYVSAQKNYLRQGFQRFVPEKFKTDVSRLINSIQRDLGGWARGLLILCFIVGTMAFIGLTILKVNYALLLGIFAGITEAIPWLGPWLGGILAVFVAFFQSPIKGLFVIILYIAIQQIENVFLVPNVMKKTVGLNPLLVIIIILIGAKLAGPIGMLLAVPIVSIFIILGREYFRLRKAGRFKTNNNQ